MGTILNCIGNEYLLRYPEEIKFLNPFLVDFDITWASRRRIYGSELSIYFLRPQVHLGDSFGFEREILTVYSEYETLEARTIQAIEKIINEEPAKGRVDTMTVFLISETKDPISWARQYITSNPESRLIVAFSAKSLRSNVLDPWYIRSLLSEQLYQRDLFDYRLPLRNDAYFFGREELVFDFYNAFKRSENRGLFGLRKTGKTSLLFKLERKILSEGNGKIFYFDCKYPPLRSLRWDQLLSRLARDILTSLNESLSDSEKTSPADAFMNSISKCPKEQQVAIVFDEIEYISPFSPLDVHWKEDFVPFWQTIWASQSRHRNLSIFIAGVNPTVVEKDLINKIQNPLFGIVPAHYLRGLSIDELRRLVRVLGRRMGMKFENDAIEYLSNRYGGHPMLTRMACSLTHNYLAENKEKMPYEITIDKLKLYEDQRDSELSFYCRHVVSELKEFYPEEYELLEYIATGQLADYLEFTSIPEYTTHLSNYGLLEKDKTKKPTISIPVVSKFIGMELARKEGRRSILKVIEKSKREFWLKQRIDSIISNIEMLRMTIERQSLPILFGILPFPESHRFFSIRICENESEFSNFINVCNRCFVDSIETYGQSIKNDKYFWNNIRNTYPAIFDSLHRIKVYRHYRVHIRLNPQADKDLMHFLETDLERRNPSQVDDLWFVLQQCVLDGLLVSILIELDRLS